MPREGVDVRIFQLAHPSFHVRIEHTRRVCIDDTLTYPNIPWSGYGTRPRVDVVLRGDCRDSENGVTRWLSPGQFTIGRALDSFYMRSQGEEALVLGIEYDLGSLGTSAPIGLPVGAMSESDRAHLAAACEELLDSSDRGERRPESAIGVVGRIVSRLHAIGLPFDSWKAKDLVTPIPPLLQRVADALGQNLSRLRTKPGVGNLERELGLSRRRIADLVSELSKRYGLNGSDWRTQRDGWRLHCGLAAMSHPDARTEDVAEAIGYGSANAFCHALREAHLPAPGQVRAELERRA
jgi:AraC-like DNA-binding protein